MPHFTEVREPKDLLEQPEEYVKLVTGTAAEPRKVSVESMLFLIRLRALGQRKRKLKLDPIKPSARTSFPGIYSDRAVLRRTKQAPPARLIRVQSPFALSRVSAPTRTW
jgi:hypothetical protein